MGLYGLRYFSDQFRDPHYVPRSNCLHGFVRLFIGQSEGPISDPRSNSVLRKPEDQPPDDKPDVHHAALGTRSRPWPKPSEVENAAIASCSRWSWASCVLAML